MEGQHGYVPPTESKTEDSQQSEFQQTGFQPTDSSTPTGFHQTGFQPTNPKIPTGFQQTGFQPTNTSTSAGFQQTGFQPANDYNSTGFQQTGFQPPPGQQTTMSAEKFGEIEGAVKAAQDALNKVSSLISDVAFTPQKSTGFEGSS